MKASTTKRDDHDLPRPLLEERPVRLSTDGLTTIRLMHDEPARSSGDWLEPRSSAGHRVQALINGRETFQAMHEALEQAQQGDLIFLTGWICDLTLKLSGEATLLDHIERAARRGVSVRVMLFRNALVVRNTEANAALAQLVRDWYPEGWRREQDDELDPRGYGEVAVVNALAERLNADVAAICDEQGTYQGAHHMKVLALRLGARVVAFVGGVDIDPSRLEDWQDTHARIEGEAAHALLGRLIARWDQHPHRPDGPWLRELAAAPPAPPPVKDGPAVQVAFTFADGTKHPFTTGFEPYGFARAGEKGIWRQLTRAIRQARRFIYFENQYFFSTHLVDELVRKLPELEHLTCVLEVHQDAPQGVFRMRELVTRLRAADPTGAKVRVFALNKWKGKRTYMHSKTWIFDDELAIIGSANACSRSYTCDSEVAAAIHGGGRSDEPSWSFARRLRVRLWAHYLGMDTPAGRAALADGVASAVHWLEAPGLFYPEVAVKSRFDVLAVDDEDFGFLQEKDEPPGWTRLTSLRQVWDLKGRDAAFDEIVDPWPADLAGE